MDRPDPGPQGEHSLLHIRDEIADRAARGHTGRGPHRSALVDGPGRQRDPLAVRQLDLAGPHALRELGTGKHPRPPLRVEREAARLDRGVRVRTHQVQPGTPADGPTAAGDQTDRQPAVIGDQAVGEGRELLPRRPGYVARASARGRGRAQLREELLVLLGDRTWGEATRVAQRCRAHPAAQFLVVDELEQGIGDGLDVTDRDEQPVHPVLDDLPRAVVAVRADDRQTAPHGLHERHAEGFVP